MMNRFIDAFRRDKRKPQVPAITKFKKIVLYGFLLYTGTLMASKFYKSNLIYTFQANDFNRSTLTQVKILEKGVYQPTIFIYLGVIQRLYAKYIQSVPYIRLIEQQFLGQKHYWVPVHHKDSQKSKVNIAVVVGGSEGLDNTMKFMMLCTYRNTLKTVGITPNDLYDTAKLHQIIQNIKQKQKVKVYGVGIQYGANLLVKYAAQYPDSLSGLVSIGNPLDLEIAQNKLHNSYIWKYLLQKSMTRIRKEKNSKIPPNASIYDLDKYIYGIEDNKIKEWKQKNSSINYINQIKTKTPSQCIIQYVYRPLEREPRLQNENCIYVQTQKGGHNQWFQSNYFTRWIVRPVSQYLKYLEKINN